MHFSDEVMAMLFDYDWPWNIRQLKQVVERFRVLADGPQIGVGDLQQRISSRYPGCRKLRDHTEVDEESPKTESNDDPETRKAFLTDRIASDSEELKQLEDLEFRAAIARNDGNVSRAAKDLGVDRNVLIRRTKAAG